MRTACNIDDEMLAPLRPCMIDDAGIEAVRPYVPFDPAADLDGFPLCCISKRTVVYSCGAIIRAGAIIDHHHPTNELSSCRRLAARAAAVMKGVEVGMGSEGSAYFSPFFVTAQIGQKPVQRLTELGLRSAFGGVILPKTRIWVEPLKQNGKWWETVLRDSGDFDAEEQEKYRQPWRAMIAWFSSQEPLHGRCFVQIGNGPEDGGAVFPRLALGITEAGSLVGIISHVVHS